MADVPECGLSGAEDEMVYPGLTRREVAQWLDDLLCKRGASEAYQRYLKGGPLPRDDDFYRINELARLLWITKK